MQKPNQLLIAFVIVLLTSTAVSAQKDLRPGYIIIKEKDTVRGFVLYRANNNEICTFSSAKGGETKDFPATSLVAYGWDNDKRYESIDIDKSENVNKVFALVLSKGAIDLYSWQGKMFLYKNDELSVIERKPDSIAKGKANPNAMDTQDVYLKDTKYVGVLNMAISDCGLTANSVQFSRKQIKQLIDKYNQCKNDFDIIDSKGPIFAFGLSVGVGALTSRMTMDSLPGVGYSSRVTPFADVAFELKMPKILDKASLNVGVQPMKITHTATNSISSSTQKITDELTLTASIIKVPITLKYDLNRLFYLRAGGWIGILQKVDYKSRRTYAPFSSPPHIDENMKVRFSYRNPTGLLVAAGVNYKTQNRLKIFGEIRFETVQGFTGNSITITSKFNTIGAMVGVGI